MGLLSCPETSVNIYQIILHNITEERRFLVTERIYMEYDIRNLY
jgi:hypothetical protein